MIWARKGSVYLLSLLLLATLLGTALATSANQTLGKPKKVEAYLAQSKLYDHFVSYTADQAKKTEGDTDQTGSVSLSDAAVQSAAQSAFPAKLIQQNVNAFLDSNYAWLEGKTATPDFKVDLSAQKATFAQKVGQYVQTYTAGLPVCADAAVAQQQSADPLAATCRPAAITPEAAGAQVTERLSTTGDFLSNPVVTAKSINPNGNQQSKPYYEKLSRLPQLYRLSMKLPVIFCVLSVLSALGIVFISLERRKGVRQVGLILLLSGVALIALKFFADFTFKKVLEQRIFNKAHTGQLQQSLTDFVHRVESAMVKTDLLFGIAFVVLALVILGILMKTRQKGNKPENTPVPAVGTAPAAERSPIFKRRKRPPADSIMPLGAKPAGETPAEPSEAPAKRKKPPRLIQ
jgi:hypothetical protein